MGHWGEGRCSGYGPPRWSQCDSASCGPHGPRCVGAQRPKGAIYRGSGVARTRVERTWLQLGRPFRSLGLPVPAARGGGHEGARRTGPWALRSGPHRVQGCWPAPRASGPCRRGCCSRLTSVVTAGEADHVDTLSRRRLGDRHHWLTRGRLQRLEAARLQQTPSALRPAGACGLVSPGGRAAASPDRCHSPRRPRRP